MHKIFRHVVAPFALLISLSTVANGARYDYLLPYVRPSSFVSAKLSPDGKHIALIGTSEHASALMLFDTDSLKFRVIRVGQLAQIGGSTSYYKDPIAVRWVTRDLMAVDFGPQAETLDLNGKTVAAIGQAVIGKAEPHLAESEMVLTFSDTRNREIALVNARSGDMRKFRLPMPGKLVHWAFDQNGELGAVTLMNSAFWKDATILENWYFSRQTMDWQKLATFKITDKHWRPGRVTRGKNKDEDSLTVFSSQGRDTMAVFRYDLQNNALGELLAGHPDVDILGETSLHTDELQSVVTGGMIPKRHWFESRRASLQRSVDHALPGAVNVLSGNAQQFVLIFSYSDRDPGRWYLFDTVTMKMREVLETRAWIAPDSMRPMQTISYKAHDGLAIPAYLTEPKDRKAPGPAVILIHGGPVARDHWEWNPEVQMLAANGYVVLQPQFRGSRGFGHKFEQAGYGQWGLAMQDDVSEGVRYLVDHGIADPKRICIVGASYGGYAALWGLAKTPGLYRCGVSIAGVVDIETQLQGFSDLNQNKTARELMRAQIGDIALNKQQFDQVSPLKHADRITTPVLLVHGRRDGRVPFEQAQKMRAALRKYNKVAEWLEFEDEGHGIEEVENKNVYYETLLRFLGKHLDVPGIWTETVAPSTASEATPSSRSWLAQSIAPATSERAWKAYTEKNWVAALELWNELLAKTPDGAWALNGRGMVHSAMDNHDQARADYQRAVALEPGNGDAWGALCWGQILARRPLQARPACEKTVALSPTSKSGHLNLGHTYLLLGDSAKAWEWYEKSIELLADEPDLQASVDDFSLFVSRGWIADQAMQAGALYQEKGKRRLANMKAAQ